MLLVGARAVAVSRGVRHDRLRDRRLAKATREVFGGRTRDVAQGRVSTGGEKRARHRRQPAHRARTAREVYRAHTRRCADTRTRVANHRRDAAAAAMSL